MELVFTESNRGIVLSSNSAGVIGEEGRCLIEPVACEARGGVFTAHAQVILNLRVKKINQLINQSFSSL